METASAAKCYDAVEQVDGGRHLAHLLARQEVQLRFGKTSPHREKIGQRDDGVAERLEAHRENAARCGRRAPRLAGDGFFVAQLHCPSAARTEIMVCTRGGREKIQRKILSKWEAPYQRCREYAGNTATA